jgi:hypothetical protein
MPSWTRTSINASNNQRMGRTDEGVGARFFAVRIHQKGVVAKGKNKKKMSDVPRVRYVVKSKEIEVCAPMSPGPFLESSKRNLGVQTVAEEISDRYRWIPL